MEGLYIIPCSGPSESLAGVLISPLFWWLALAIVVRSPQLEAIARPGFCDNFPPFRHPPMANRAHTKNRLSVISDHHHIARVKVDRL